MEQSEIGIVAVPSSADSWTNVNTFTVPAGVKRIKKLRLAVAPDWGTSATSVRMAPVFRLIGSGLLEQSPHEFLGKFGGEATTTSGAFSMDDLAIEYDVDIPVVTGGTITAQVNTVSEAITAGTVTANIIYDDQAPTSKNSMSQYISAAGTTTADAYASVGTLTIPQAAQGKSPTKIKKLIIGVGVDQGTSAISLRTSTRLRLSGSGIQGGGLHDYTGPVLTDSQVTPGSIKHDRATVVIDVDIDINAGGQIVVEHQFDVETPTASTIALGVVYA